MYSNYSFVHLHCPENSEGTFYLPSQAATCPPVSSIPQRRLYTIFNRSVVEWIPDRAFATEMVHTGSIPG